jgi:hypothetical protein
VGWWDHLFAIRLLFSADNKYKWILQHIDSFVVFVVTIATILLIILLLNIGPDEFYYIPTKRGYFDQKIGLPSP